MTRYPNWMGDFLANTPKFGSIPINQLIIPGSHDSGTYEMGESARTQNLSLLEQLEGGIRYFDLRPQVHDNVFYIHHGILSSGTDVAAWPTPNVDTSPLVFGKVRQFLKEHPSEILILKFQDFKNFGPDDYTHFIELLKQYFTFDLTRPIESHCKLVTLTHANQAELKKQTVKSLVEAGKRVFVFFDIKDVPKGRPEIWNWAWQYAPSKTKTHHALWDPFWEDFSSSLADDKQNEVDATWFPWHAKMLDAWGGDGFFVTQSQMQVLHGTDGCSGYYNKAERAAKATSGEFRDAHHHLISNNARNISQYLAWAQAGKMLNIITFDFVEYGGIVDKIMAYYRDVTAG